MWYSVNKSELDYSKPIVAENNRGDKYLLLPQINTQFERTVIVKGYNWFNIKTGNYNSCSCWASAKKAVDAYIDSYSFYNVDIVLNKL